MSRVSAFGNPFFLGFEDLEQLLERTASHANEGYPPYNIEHIGARQIRISLAIAGFKSNDLAITVDSNQLIISGKLSHDQNDKNYLHRGIAARQFMRKFILADGMEVTDAFLEHGLLHIDLERPEPKSSKRSIPIRG